VKDSTDKLYGDLFGMNQQDHLSKVSTIIGFTGISVSVASLYWIPPVSGYGISIYSIFPYYFWIIVGIVASLGMFIASINSHKSRVYYYLGLSITTIIISIVLLIPFFRGYAYFGRGDPLTQLGRVVYILESGRLDPNNIYPIAHLNRATIVQILGVNIRTVVLTYPIVNYFLLAFAGIPLSRRFTSNRLAQLTAAILFLLPLYGIKYLHFTARNDGFFILPTIVLAFVISMNEQSFRGRFLMFLSALAIVFFHPVNAILTALILATLKYSPKIISPGLSRIHVQRTPVINVFAAFSISYFLWYFSSAGVRGLLRREIIFLLTGAGRTEAQQIGGFFGSFSALELLGIAFWRYTVVLILGLTVLGLLAYLLSVDCRLWYQSATLRSLTLLFVFFSILAVFANFFILSNFDRLSKFVIIIATLVIVVSIGDISRQQTNRQTVKIFLFAILSLLLVFSLVSIYGGAHNKENNQQVSEPELSGMDWVLDNKAEQTAIDGFGLFPARYSHTINGYEANTGVEDNYVLSSPPDHFGLHNHTGVGEAYNEPHVLVVSDFTREYYPGLFPNKQWYWKYTPEDIRMLQSDQTVNHIYSGGKTDVYDVSPQMVSNPE